MKVQNKDNKGNPYHSDSNGRFTSADGGGVKSEEKENQEILDKPLDNLKNLSYTVLEKSGIGGFSFITKKGESNPKEDKLRALLEDKEEKLETKPRKKRDKVKYEWGKIPYEYRVKIEDTLNGLLDDYNVGLGDLAGGGYKLRVYYNGRYSARFGHCHYGPDKLFVRNGQWYYDFSFDIMLSSHFKDEQYSDVEHRYVRKIYGSKLANIERPGLSTVSHEYAHHISHVYKIKVSKNREAIERYLSVFRTPTNADGVSLAVPVGARDILNNLDRHAFSSVLRERPLEDKIYTRLANEYGLTLGQMEARVKQEYGTYATETRGEFFAEAFANMRHLKDEDKTDFMRSFERIFNEEFNLVFGG